MTQTNKDYSGGVLGGDSEPAIALAERVETTLSSIQVISTIAALIFEFMGGY